jgi:muconate cycloisomerase
LALRAVKLEIYRTAIAMRGFEHAAAKRDVAEAVVARVELSDGRRGWGETLPRPYVTGESIESVISDLARTHWPLAAAANLSSSELPIFQQRARDGRCTNAAACALELAMADAMLAEEGWGRLSRRGLAPRIGVRVSGVLGSADAGKTARKLRLMRLFGLRDFKLKLGLGPAADEANLRVVARQIGPAIAAGRCSLRVDVNGGWSVGETPRRVAELKAFGVRVVEQPVFCLATELADLAGRCELPLMADESLLTEDDARCLLPTGARVWWNIRLSKNGGLRRSLALVEMAAGAGIPFVIGCMVGESGILSAAQRRLLQLSVQPAFIEGNYGRFLLKGDLCRNSPRFGYGGRLNVLRGNGLGIAVDETRLARYGKLAMTLTV